MLRGERACREERPRERGGMRKLVNFEERSGEHGERKMEVGRMDKRLESTRGEVRRRKLKKKD